MEDDLQILVEFLSRCCQPDVHGRGSLQPHSEDAIKLLRFSSGKCSEQEREEVCAKLRLHPAWLRWLADRVKASRSMDNGARYVHDAAA